MITVDELADEKYVLLTTFRRDGSGVATPLWAVRDGAALVAWTPKDSWKVKRIRRDPRVTVAPCDLRGNVSGPAVDGRARIGDDADLARARTLLGRKYGLLGRLTVWGSRLRRGADGTVAVVITLP